MTHEHAHTIAFSPVGLADQPLFSRGASPPSPLSSHCAAAAQGCVRREGDEKENLVASLACPSTN